MLSILVLSLCACQVLVVALMVFCTNLDGIHCMQLAYSCITVCSDTLSMFKLEPCTISGHVVPQATDPLSNHDSDSPPPQSVCVRSHTTQRTKAGQEFFVIQVSTSSCAFTFS